MAEEQDERTEQATDTRREDFRKRGQVAMTRELSTAVLFLMAAGLILVLGQFFFKNLLEIFQVSFGQSMLKMVQYNEWSDLFFFVCKKFL